MIDGGVTNKTWADQIMKHHQLVQENAVSSSRSALTNLDKMMFSCLPKESLCRGIVWWSGWGNWKQRFRFQLTKWDDHKEQAWRCDSWGCSSILFSCSFFLLWAAEATLKWLYCFGIIFRKWGLFKVGWAARTNNHRKWNGLPGEWLFWNLWVLACRSKRFPQKEDNLCNHNPL